MSRETVMPKAIEIIRRKFVPETPTREERQKELDRLDDEYTLSNGNIWLSIIGSSVLAKKRFYYEDAMKIAQAYETFQEVFPENNTPVSNLLYVAGRTDLANDPMFKKVCFDYQAGIEGKQNLKNGYQRIREEFPEEHEIMKLFWNGTIQELHYSAVENYIDAKSKVDNDKKNRSVFDLVRSDIATLESRFNLYAFGEYYNEETHAFSKSYFDELGFQRGKSFYLDFKEYLSTHIPNLLNPGELIQTIPTPDSNKKGEQKPKIVEMI